LVLDTFNVNRICVLGNVKENLILKVKEHPKIGETVRAYESESKITGKVKIQFIFLFLIF